MPMKTINICGVNQYNPLIPAMRAIFQTPSGTPMEIIMDNEEVFKDLKEYLSEQNIGFREIYDEERMTLQFTNSHE